jgi:hypothetical protein
LTEYEPSQVNHCDGFLFDEKENKEQLLVLDEEIENTLNENVRKIELSHDGQLLFSQLNRRGSFYGKKKNNDLDRCRDDSGRRLCLVSIN